MRGFVRLGTASDTYHGGAACQSLPVLEQELARPSVGLPHHYRPLFSSASSSIPPVHTDINLLWYQSHSSHEAASMHLIEASQNTTV